MVLAFGPLAPRLAFAHLGEGRGKMSDFFSNIWVTLVAPLVVLFIGAVAATWSWPRIQRRIAARDLPAGDASHFTILVVELEDDDEKRSQTKHVIQSLRAQFGAHLDSKAFAVIDYPMVLKSGNVGLLDQRDKAAEQKGRDWLREKNAHLLIWGSVAEANKVVRLRFLPVEGDGQNEKGYKLSDILELPSNFKYDLSAGLAAYVLSEAIPAFDATKSLVKIIEPLLPRMKNVVDHGGVDLSAECYGSICTSAAVSFLIFGQHSGEQYWMDESLAAFSKAAAASNPDELPNEWAVAQCNLGAALAAVAEQKESIGMTALLERGGLTFEVQHMFVE